MMKHKHSRGCCLLVLVALSANLHAREVMSWVPPYAVETCKTVLEIVDESGNVVISYPAQSPDVFDVNYGILQRCYWLENTSNLLNAAWHPVPGSTNIVSSDGMISCTNALPAKVDFYRVGVSLR